MSFKGAIRWGLKPKRVGILLAKLILAGATELAAQNTPYAGAWCEGLTVPSQAQEQRRYRGTLQEHAPAKSGRKPSISNNRYSLFSVPFLGSELEQAPKSRR